MMGLLTAPIGVWLACLALAGTEPEPVEVPEALALLHMAYSRAAVEEEVIVRLEDRSGRVRIDRFLVRTEPGESPTVRLRLGPLLVHSSRSRLLAIHEDAEDAVMVREAEVATPMSLVDMTFPRLAVPQAELAFGARDLAQPIPWGPKVVWTMATIEEIRTPAALARPAVLTISGEGRDDNHLVRYLIDADPGTGRLHKFRAAFHAVGDPEGAAEAVLELRIAPFAAPAEEWAINEEGRRRVDDPRGLGPKVRLAQVGDAMPAMMLFGDRLRVDPLLPAGPGPLTEPLVVVMYPAGGDGALARENLAALACDSLDDRLAAVGPRASPARIIVVAIHPAGGFDEGEWFTALDRWRTRTETLSASRVEVRWSGSEHATLRKLAVAMDEQPVVLAVVGVDRMMRSLRILTPPPEGERLNVDAEMALLGG